MKGRDRGQLTGEGAIGKMGAVLKPGRVQAVRRSPSEVVKEPT